MNQKHILLRGALILTLTGFVSRIIGFFYRIFLSHTIGAEGVGIYQLIFPVYTMAFSLTAAGIQTAISRNVSARMATGDKRGAKDMFLAGAFLTTSTSLIVSVFLYQGAPFLAEYFLREVRCESLIRILAFALPFAGIHSCVSGYYFGLKQTNIPALSQLIEQIARVSTSYLVYLILLERGMAVTPLLAVIGLLFEEGISALFCLSAMLFHFAKEKLHLSTLPKIGDIKSIFTLSFPLTANRLLINLLQSIEAICIPLRLQLFGLTSTSSLETYGVLTGMALPLILFPSAITNAISVLLLPAISEAQAVGNRHQIAKTIESTIRYSLGLGILCTGLFLCFGQDLGTLLFGNSLASSFILILAWICPFLYLGSTLSSILNGLGKTMTTFWQNTISLIIRILFVWFGIPVFGIASYLWGLLASQLFFASIALFMLSHYAAFSFDVFEWLIKPLSILALSVGLMLSLRFLLEAYIPSLPLLWKIMLLALFLSLCYLLILFFQECYIFFRKKGILKS